ncbi:hypothetical protein A2Y85_05810 [candidate division WOR-3 bacterium RBG_13_43_14]|uniref:Mce/MlaD domain-containing protein n=1 Tax=candidate division WOR-3 bacterium RBG_13_43_14 TaxID=1802590 RepID=A0A1F4U589_UNCW3|nr:MAG: hypothetical protein A2Y85_05810 [candidate division WOR-3 bacterium RBG_13_43_14]
MARGFKDTLVGFFVIATVVIFIGLYTWLTGRLGWGNTHEIEVYFQDVGGLKVGDPVIIYGLEKGKIKSMKLQGNRVLTVLSISKNIELPKDSQFELRSVSLLGGDRYVKITLGVSDTAATEFDGQFSAFDFETVLSDVSRLAKVIENMKPIDLDIIGKKLETTLDRSIKNLSTAFQEPGDRLNELAQRLDSLAILIQGEGTLGKLIRSDDLYQEIRDTNQSLKELLEDIKANPQRYINVKVF